MKEKAPTSPSKFADHSLELPPSYSLFVPAIGMMCVSGIWAIVHGFQTWSMIFGSLPPSGQIREIPAYWAPAIDSFVLTFATSAFQMAAALFIVFGATCLLKRRRFGIALFAAILSSIPFCSGFFVLGMPFGIWAIVMLFQPGVRATFR